MSIDHDTIQRLERLAGVALTDPERDAMRASLSRIIEHFRTIQSIDIRNAPPYAGPAPVLRDDVATPGADVNDTVREAPQLEEGFFAVPPPFERGDDG